MAGLIFMQARQGGDARLDSFLVKEAGMRGNTESAMATAAGPRNGAPGQYEQSTWLDQLLMTRVDAERAKKGRKTTIIVVFFPILLWGRNTCALLVRRRLPLKYARDLKRAATALYHARQGVWESGHKQDYKKLQRRAAKDGSGPVKSTAP